MSLLAEGVDRVFGYPGGAIMPVYDRLYDYTDRLEHVLVRHEQGAAHAAQGYARATGRTGVVIVTSGPGATNIVTGLSDALMDSTPMVVITGQVAAPMLGTEAFQETDVVAITHPISKLSTQIRRAEDIPAAVAKAFYVAKSGRPGPVVLDIAKDAQVGLLEWNGYTPCNFIRSYCPVPEVDEEKIAAVARMINRAERPMILSGHGVMISQAEDELRAVAEKADIPVAATLLGLSTMPSDHRLDKGMLGMHGNIGPNHNTNQADLLIAIGMRFDDRVTGDVSRYARQARIVHIDIDGSEYDKNVKVDSFVHGDAREVLARLLPLLEKANHSEWLSTFDRCDEIEREQVIKPEVTPGSGLMKMGEVAAAVSAATDHKAVIVTDVGQNQMFASRYCRYTGPRSFITSGGLGTMGFGLPAAIGAKMGDPGRTVCLFVGDGGLQMTIQEFGTIMQYGVDVKIVLLNNNFLGNVRQWQQMFFNSRFSQTPMLNPDFVTVAAAYGIAGENVDSRQQLAGAVERMLCHDGAYLLNVNIDPTDLIFPMITPGSAVDEIMIAPGRRFEFQSK